MPFLNKVYADALTMLLASISKNSLKLLLESLLPKPSVLGTDGFGRSDSRSSLREFFEIDDNSIVRASAYTLFKNGTLDKKKLKGIYDDLEVDPLKPNPWEV